MTTNDPLDSLLDSLTLDQLPALPKIHDPAIAKAAITHRSYSAAYRQTGAVEDNYEKLAHVGDALLGVSVVLLLHELWPQMNKGEATTLKSRLVSSTTLAALSSTYGIPATIRMPPSGQTSILNNERNAAEMFEAHVGAVYTDQLQRAAADARAQKAQAYMAVSDWLQALFTPLAQAGYNPANIGEERENELAVGALPALHEHIQKYSWPTAKYEDSVVSLSATTDPGEDHKRCENGLTVREELATRTTKAQAKTVAGWKVWRQIEAEMFPYSQGRRRF